MKEMGGLNALVNNAGIIRDGLLVKKDRETGGIKKLPTSDWNAVIAVNLTGATLMAREVAAKMVETGTSGCIVNISSVSRHGNRGQSNYVAAKASLAMNAVTWARDLAPFGIRACAVAPGMIETTDGCAKGNCSAAAGKPTPCSRQSAEISEALLLRICPGAGV